MVSLKRIESCWARIQKSTDKISNDKLIENTLGQFKSFLIKKSKYIDPLIEKLTKISKEFEN